MTFNPEQIKALEAKLDHKHVKPPPQGKYGSYIEGWHAIAEANRIFGFDGWSYRVDSLIMTNSGQRNDKTAVGYMAMITVEAGGVSRQDVGHGQGFSKSEGDAHDSAIKEAVTDGLKRALKSFGNPFGLALYDKSGENVERSNGSTRPPPKQQAEPEIPLVDRLVRGIKDRSSIVGLDKFVTQASFVASFDELPDHERQLVQKNIDAKHKALSEGNPLAGG